jgi:hypothetical protein
MSGLLQGPCPKASTSSATTLSLTHTPRAISHRGISSQGSEWENTFTSHTAQLVMRLCRRQFSQESQKQQYRLFLRYIVGAKSLKLDRSSCTKSWAWCILRPALQDKGSLDARSQHCKLLESPTEANEIISPNVRGMC